MRYVIHQPTPYVVPVPKNLSSVAKWKEEGTKDLTSIKSNSSHILAHIKYDFVYMYFGKALYSSLSRHLLIVTIALHGRNFTGRKCRLVSVIMLAYVTHRIT